MPHELVKDWSVAFAELLGDATAETFPQAMHGQHHPGGLGHQDDSPRNARSRQPPASPARSEGEYKVTVPPGKLCEGLAKDRMKRHGLVSLVLRERRGQDNAVAFEVEPGP